MRRTNKTCNFNIVNVIDIEFFITKWSNTFKDLV